MAFLKIIKIALFLIFIFIACTENKYSKESKYFENYLMKSFNKKYPDKKGYFFIIPNNGCMGCRKTVLNFILSKDYNPQYCYAIISQPDDETMSLIKNIKNVMIDEKGRIDRLNLQTANTVMIVTEKGNIKNIISLSFQNVDSIRRFLKIY
jgi:hypothetical protein